LAHGFQIQHAASAGDDAIIAKAIMAKTVGKARIAATPPFESHGTEIIKSSIQPAKGIGCSFMQR